MFKKPISLALTVLGATATCWVAACGSSNKSSPTTSTSTSTRSVSTGSGTSTTSSGSTSTVGNGSSSTVTSTGSSSSCSAVLADGGSDALIDNMTSTATGPIAFVATCAEKGAWYTFADDGATVTPAQGSQFTYSALPSGYPGPGGGGSSSTSDGGDGGSSAQAACVSGTTAATQYAVAGMGVQLGSVNPPTDGGASQPALINASSFTGVEFWLWASSATAAEVSSSLIVQFGDVNEDPSYGVCNPDASGLPTSCGSAGAAVSGSPVSSSNGAGALTVEDGGNATIVSGWQLIQVPWTNFLVNQYYGGAQETQLDPAALTKLQFQIQQVAADASAGIMFDFCVKDVSFY
ncbi:MAG TPA: hypothetical protein VEK07_06310 [Polyangiaceae bacterium]|nr:hypothetical protein [Polyangiaceae bacterium]